MCPNPVTNDTDAGTDTGVVGGDNTFDPPTTPFPTCPFAFWPQQYIAPVDVNTHAWMYPQLTDVTPDGKPATTDGVDTQLQPVLLAYPSPI